MLRRRCVRREAIPDGGDATRLRSERPFLQHRRLAKGVLHGSDARPGTWLLLFKDASTAPGGGWHSQATSPGTLPAMRCSASAARMGISFGEVGLGFSDLLTNDVHVRSGAYHPPSTTST